MAKKYSVPLLLLLIIGYPTETHEDFEFTKQWFQDRQQYAGKLYRFANDWHRYDLMHEYEKNQLDRLLDYIDVVGTPHAEAMEQSILQRDFKNFYQQYDQRRNKNFTETFPALADWYNTL